MDELMGRNDGGRAPFHHISPLEIHSLEKEGSQWETSEKISLILFYSLSGLGEK